MALARVQYEQQVAGTTDFTVTMPYISRDHILVSVDGVPATFTWLNDTTIKLTTAPVVGAIIDIHRETKRDGLMVDFQDASTITEQQLDLSARQTFYIAQEAFDATGGTMAVADDGSYSATNRRISLVGYPDSNDDAANVQYVQDVLTSSKNAFDERTLAEAARDKAQKWAENPENTAVDPGLYSSKHHAAKSQASANAAKTSETNAGAARDKAKQWSEEATDVAVEPGLYSAKHHAAKSAGSASASQTSANNAANSATTATNEANRSKAEADRSFNEAERAKGYATSINIPSAVGNALKFIRQKADETGFEYIAPGANGGIDADTVDGVHAATFARKDQANAFTQTQTAPQYNIGDANARIKRIDAGSFFENVAGIAVSSSLENNNLAVNAVWDGVNWNRLDTAKLAYLLVLGSDGTFLRYYAPAGANPIAWTRELSLRGPEGGIFGVTNNIDPSAVPTLPAHSVMLGWNRSGGDGELDLIAGSGGSKNSILRLYSRNSDGTLTQHLAIGNGGYLINEGYIAPALLNGWVNYDTAYNPAGYYKDKLGIVHLRGLIYGGTATAGTALLTLPAGYRPLYRYLFDRTANGAQARVDVKPDGNVTIEQGGDSWLSLDGISFRAEQ